MHSQFREGCLAELYRLRWTYLTLDVKAGGTQPVWDGCIHEVFGRLKHGFVS